MSDSIHIVCPHCQSINRVPANKSAEKPNCGRCQHPLSTGEPIDPTIATLARYLEHSDLPLLANFWAPWCGPRKMMVPQFEQVISLLEPKVRSAEVNTKAEPHLVVQFGIRSTPTLILFRGGHEVARQAGAMGVQDIMRWVALQLPRRFRCDRVVFSDSPFHQRFTEREGTTLMNKESGYAALDEIRSQRRLMTVYKRSEQFVAITLSGVIASVTAISLIQLIRLVLTLLVMGALNPPDHKVFQLVLGATMMLLIAMEFRHSIVKVALCKESTIQVKTVILIAILALARKPIILEPDVNPAKVAALAETVLALDLTCWLMREHDDCKSEQWRHDLPWSSRPT